MTIYGRTKFQKRGVFCTCIRKEKHTCSRVLTRGTCHLSTQHTGTMAVPTYDELLAHYDVEKSIMKQTFDDEHLREFSLVLDVFEILAKFLGIPNPDITVIKNQGCAIEQPIRMLECWKQRCGSMATYEAMVKALLKIKRTDLAEKVITLRQSSNAIPSLETATTNQSLSSPTESSLISPTSPAGSSGTEEASLEAAISPLSLPATPNEYPTQYVISTLRELEEEFYDLVIFIEDTLKHSEVSLDTMTRRFRMLPQSVRRQHQTDENYTATRQKILNSTTIKELFDNLTELKQWNYMTPDTLAHIVKDVKIDDVHRKINKYKAKLLAFKATTKLRELVGISFPVPDYCMELTMEVEGWEDKTIQEVEDRAVNIVRRAAYSGSPHVRLGWKGVFPGSINVIFILMESVRVIPERFLVLKESGVVSIHLDGDTVHSKDYTKVNHKSKHPCISILHLTFPLYYYSLLLIKVRYQGDYGIARVRRCMQLVVEGMF
jgi:hypothetical protein